MTILRVLRQTARLSAVILTTTILARAQQPRTLKQISIILPTGPGRIIVPTSEDFQWKTIGLYDRPTHVTFEGTNITSQLQIAYALSARTGTAKSCRDDMLFDALHRPTFTMGGAEAKQLKKSEQTEPNGKIMETASFFVDTVNKRKIDQQTLLGTYASPTACAQVVIVKSSYTPADQAVMDAQLAALNFEPDYVPTSQDYFALGTILYRVKKSYVTAATYYQRALDTLPPDAPVNIRRLMVDQLAMSYGQSNQIKSSRDVIEAAIKSDPDYPLYYYNLACADAEQGKAQDAKTHLQQAFDRKANTIPGEKMPDPTQDDSIQKLKSNSEFWAFVQTLK